MSNEENMTDIAAKETLVTDYFKYIFKQLKKKLKKKKQYGKIDKIAQT